MTSGHFRKKARSQKVKKNQKTLDEEGGKWKKRQRRRYIICCYWSNYLSYRKCSCRVGYCVKFTIWDTFWDLFSVFSFLVSYYGFVIRNDTPWYYQGSSNEDFARYDVLLALKPIRVNLWLSSSINYHLKRENEKFWDFKTWWIKLGARECWCGIIRWVIFDLMLNWRLAGDSFSTDLTRNLSN